MGKQKGKLYFTKGFEPRADYLFGNSQSFCIQMVWQNTVWFKVSQSRNIFSIILSAQGEEVRGMKHLSTRHCVDAQHNQRLDVTSENRHHFIAEHNSV